MPLDGEADAERWRLDAFHRAAVEGSVGQALWRQAMGDEYPDGADPSSSCTRSLLAGMVAALQLRPGDCLVDLGCGRGGPGLWVAKETGATLVGLDLSPLAISLATEAATRFALKDQPRFHVGSFEQTGVAAASADGVMSVDAFPFAPDRDAALRELRRILRPGARAVFTAVVASIDDPGATPSAPSWHDRIGAAGLDLEGEDHREDEPLFWARLYSLWEEHEEALRSDMGNSATDLMLAEARTFGPRLPGRRAVLFTVRRGP